MQPIAPRAASRATSVGSISGKRASTGVQMTSSGSRPGRMTGGWIFTRGGRPRGASGGGSVRGSPRGSPRDDFRAGGGPQTIDSLDEGGGAGRAGGTAAGARGAAPKRSPHSGHSGPSSHAPPA